MKYILDSEIEDHTKSVIFADLHKGDPDRDVPHTEAIVYYIKQIIDSLPDDSDIDPAVLLIAAYAHDWGYAPFFNPGQPLGFDEYMLAKKKHMDVGAKLTKDLLEGSVYRLLTEEQKKRIVHLVQVHDKLDKLDDFDEIILMEADTIAGLDTDFMKPTFDPESNEKYLASVRKKRQPLFQTTYSRELFDEVLQKRVKYYEDGLWKR